MRHTKLGKKGQLTADQFGNLVVRLFFSTHLSALLYRNPAKVRSPKTRNPEPPAGLANLDAIQQMFQVPPARFNLDVEIEVDLSHQGL